MSKGSWFSQRVHDEVALLGLDPRLSAKAIHNALNDPERGIDSRDIPTVRTIQQWLLDLRDDDTSPAWVPMAAADANQATRVLPVLAAAIETGGVQRWLSRDLAALVDRVVLAAPTVPPLWAWSLARAYQRARQRHYDTRGLDLTLALAPWQNQQAAITWADLMRDLEDRPGGWPGGGAGIMALAARLPPPDWTTNKRRSETTWGAILWQVLTNGIDGMQLEDEPHERSTTR